MSFDLKDIAANYAKKTDSELIYTATQNAQGLRPGVMEIIENELRKRNIKLNVLEGAKAQNRSYTFDEIDEISQKLRGLACPICNGRTSKLNGTVLYTLKSFFFFSFSRSEIIVACPYCLDQKSNGALRTTALLGWWGLPGGFKTPLYIHYNIRSKKQNRISGSNEALINFTLQNIGQIESYKNNEKQLHQLLLRHSNG